MAPMSRGSGASAGKASSVKLGRKGGTATTKKYRFQSFSQRIENFNVDPVRRGQVRAHAHHLEDSSESSHFAVSFQHWKDLNLSEDFTAFTEKVEPLCRTLPQILHHERQIVDHLMIHIQRGDALSLEPLLDLVVHTARDLGSRFEPHFERILSAIIHLAAQHSNVEVIEWSFTCIACLFKYLSRLLVPDMRALFNLMAPLLGQTHQKTFVTKFAAEAMSYLIRKAAAASVKDSKPLRVIVEQAFTDLSQTSVEQKRQYQQGLSSLFAESIKSIKQGVSSHSHTIFATLISCLLHDSFSSTFDSDVIMRLIEDVLVEVFMHASPENLAPLLEACMAATASSISHHGERALLCTVKLMFICIGVCKGAKIQDWSKVLSRLLQCLNTAQTAIPKPNTATLSRTLDTVAVVIQYAPYEGLLQVLDNLLARLRADIWEPHFVKFCLFTAEIGANRFKELLLPELQRFIISSWNDNELQICFALPVLQTFGVFSGRTLRFPAEFRKQLSRYLHQLVNSSPDVFVEAQRNTDSSPTLPQICNCILDALDCINNMDIHDNISEPLLQMVQLASTHTDNIIKPGSGSSFAATKALYFLAEHVEMESLRSKVWPNILLLAKKHSQCILFLQALLKALDRLTSTIQIDESTLTELGDELEENLTSSFHELRLLSLEVLQSLYRSAGRPESNGLNAALTLEQSSFTFEAGRSASMIVRQLISAFEDPGSDARIRRALCTYCFGLLHVRLASVWDDACGALRVMSDFRGFDDLIMDHTIEWLTQTPEKSSFVDEVYGPNKAITEEHSCGDRNLTWLKGLATRTDVDVEYIRKRIQETLIKNTTNLQLPAPANRAQALRVLKAIPSLAERKSRLLVPLLLAWVSADPAETSDSGPSSLADDASEYAGPKMTTQYANPWSRVDKKVMLSIFTLFTNPRTLYRADEVYQFMLSYLSNGDVEIQRLALQAILSWGQPAIQSYADHLLNLLDDARLREEIDTFLQIDHLGDGISLQHRAELMPVLLRLLYGRTVSQVGTTNNGGAQKARRRAILTCLSHFRDQELGDYLSIALGPLNDLARMDLPAILNCISNGERLSLRRQAAMMRLLEDIMEILADRAEPFLTLIINAVLYCVIRATRALVHSREALGNEAETEPKSSSLLKTCRQEGISCINMAFEACPDFQWSSYAALIIEEIVRPRLEKLPIESSQSISGLLRLFATWSKSSISLTFLVDLAPEILHRVADCLTETFTQDEVKLFILKDIICAFLDQMSAKVLSLPSSKCVIRGFDGTLHSSLGHTIADGITQLLQRNPSKEILNEGVETLLRLTPYVTESVYIEKITITALKLLQRPARAASPRIKGKLMSLVQQTSSQYGCAGKMVFHEDMLYTLSPLFSYFKDGPNRRTLVSIFGVLASYDDSIKEVAELCKKLNAFSSKKLDQPDFDERLQALQTISEVKGPTLTAKQWLPLVHNIIFLIKDNDEFSMRATASLCLRQFVRQASHSSCNDSLDRILNHAVVPAVESGMSESSELIRLEFVSVLAEMIQCSWRPVADMACLLGTDDDSSVFKNILHIQSHRRMRALRRLASESSSIASENISRFCLPLIENFLTDAEDGDHNLGAESVNTLEALSQGLDWQRYRVLLQQATTNAIKTNSKLRIRALGAVVNGFHHAQRGAENATSSNGDEIGDTTETKSLGNLARSLPNRETLSKSIMQSTLTKLMESMHFKDESAVDIRVLIAPISIKLLMSFQKQQIEANLPSILMDTCNILRSKAQEARDMARKGLADITALIGPTFFGFVIKQLRSSLQRGSQLHVLSYTVHSIIISTAPSLKPGDIDYCLRDLMDIIINDIFGATGQEKESEDYISRMKEVKKRSLSFDTTELLASITTLGHVSVLLEPIKEQMTKSKPKWNHVDELLRRIREGLRRNNCIKSQDSLTLSFEILRDAYQSLIYDQSRSANTARKMAGFAVDLLRRILDKYEEYKTPDRLIGFLPMLRYFIAQEDDDVQIATIRLMISIIKIPTQEFDENAKFYVRIARKVIDAAPSTNGPLAQTAIRLVSAILRERPNAQISKSELNDDIAHLLGKVKPDLHIPSRQGDREQQVAAFNFVKAVVGRKQPVPKLYEIMDVVREVMISSTEPPVPELARSVFSRFVLDYFPQEMKGFSKQLDFLIANLQYPHPRGRLSVMEVVMFVLTHKHEVEVQSTLAVFFLPLTVSLNTESNLQCRDSATLLLRKIFERADKEHLHAFKSQMAKWIEPETNALWKQAGFKCWLIYLEAHNTAAKNALTVRNRIENEVRAHMGTSMDDNAPLLLAVLRCLHTICCKFPTIAFAPDSAECWSAVMKHWNSNLHDICIISTSLIALYTNEFARSARKTGALQKFPISNSVGLKLDGSQAYRIVETGIRILQGEKDESILGQIIQVVATVGRLSAAVDSDEIIQKIFREAAAVARAEGANCSLQARLSSVNLILALVKLVPREQIALSLREILLPLQNVLDPIVSVPTQLDSASQAVQDGLMAQAQELSSILQMKIGASEYIAVMQDVQRTIKERREERRSKRRIEAVSAPERMEIKRHMKNFVKATKRREKNAQAAGQRRGW